MATKIPTSCPPDTYLTKNHLQELFDDFNASIENSQPTASTFSALVNSVRLAYTTPFAKAREEALSEARRYEREISELRKGRDRLVRAGAAQHLEEFSPLAKHIDSIVSGVIAAQAGRPIPSPDTGLNEQAILPWPANTFTLNIYSTRTPYRCDFAEWDDGNQEDDSNQGDDSDQEDQWPLRMDFEVFKFKEPGTVKIKVWYNRSSRSTLAVRGEGKPGSRWKEHLCFWAYEKQRPGTQMIWSGYKDSPERGIFVKGEHGVGSWDHKCEFWVPL